MRDKEKDITDKDLIIGDIVVLNSGGPNMTIYKIEEGMVFCKWIAGDKLKRVSKASFPIRSVYEPGDNFLKF